MTTMSAPSTGYRVGFAFGTLTREFLHAIKRPTAPMPGHPTPVVQLANFAPTRKDWDDLCRIPALARRGVDLNKWFEDNTKAVPPLRMGPLDELIAPIATV